MRGLLLAGAVLGSLLALAASAAATFPGANGLIGYLSPNFTMETAGAGPPSQLLLLASDGSRFHQITDDHQPNFEARWSPDGSQVLFGGRRSPAPGSSALHVYVMPASGGRKREVPCASECSDPSWTPDGSRVIVVTTVGGVRGIYTLALDGSDPRLVLAAPAGASLTEPVISPNGRWLAYVEATGDISDPVHVMVADADGSRPHRIASGYGPDWSPDGNLLAYTQDNIATVGPQWIYVADPSGTQQVSVAPAGDLVENGASWSPDGSELVFVAVRPTGSVEIGALNYLLAVHAPHGTTGQPAGPSTRGCLDGYRIILKGDVQAPSWGTNSPRSGSAGHPADVPCTKASAPRSNLAKALLHTAISTSPGELRLRVRLARGAQGNLVVGASIRGRALRQRGRLGRGALRTYRFAVPHGGRVLVAVQFVGGSGWASTRPHLRRVRVRARPRR